MGANSIGISIEIKMKQLGQEKLSDAGECDQGALVQKVVTVLSFEENLRETVRGGKHPGISFRNNSPFRLVNVLQTKRNGKRDIQNHIRVLVLDTSMDFAFARWQIIG